MHFLFFFYAFLITTNGAFGDYFKEIEQLFVQHKAHVATEVLAEDLMGVEDKPKEIEIIIPEVFAHFTRVI